MYEEDLCGTVFVVLILCESADHLSCLQVIYLETYTKSARSEESAVGSETGRETETR